MGTSLSQHETDAENSQRYRGGAANILDSLTSSTYLSTDSKNAGLLLHGARTYPGENRTYMFGDYYFCQAIRRWSQLLPTPYPRYRGCCTMSFYSQFRDCQPDSALDASQPDAIVEGSR